MCGLCGVAVIKDKHCDRLMMRAVRGHAGLPCWGCWVRWGQLPSPLPKSADLVWISSFGLVLKAMNLLPMRANCSSTGSR